MSTVYILTWWDSLMRDDGILGVYATAQLAMDERPDDDWVKADDFWVTQNDPTHGYIVEEWEVLYPPVPLYSYSGV